MLYNLIPIIGGVIRYWIYVDSIVCTPRLSRDQQLSVVEIGFSCFVNP